MQAFWYKKGDFEKTNKNAREMEYEPQSYNKSDIVYCDCFDIEFCNKY